MLSKNKNLLRRIFRVENLDQLILIALALAVSIMGAFELTTEKAVVSVTLGCLGVIAIGILVIRSKLEAGGRGKVDELIEFHLQKPPELMEWLGAEKQISIMGLGLRSTISDNLYALKTNIANGAKLKILLLDVHNPLHSPQFLDEVVKRFSRGGTAENFVHDFQKTLSQLADLRDAAANPDDVQVKVVSFVPPFCLYVFPQRGSGMALIEMYGYRSQVRSAPKFMVTQRYSPDWYEHFSTQFEKVWKDADPVNPSKYGRSAS